jgi:hypothetical protein
MLHLDIFLQKKTARDSMDYLKLQNFEEEIIIIPVIHGYYSMNIGNKPVQLFHFHIAE